MNAALSVKLRWGGGGPNPTDDLGVRLAAVEKWPICP